MSKYYRELDKTEKPNCKTDKCARNGLRQLGQLWLRPVEIDDWRPASEPPTDKDFMPTGWLLIWRVDNGPDITNIEGIYLEDYTHWSHITPPKQ